MHGNISVQFEDVGQAVTELHKYIDNLHQAGFTKIAATGIGNFTQYEDIQDILTKIKSSDKTFQMDVIPAVKCFFESPAQTLSLIAKDYEGYLSLCRIITESNALGTVIEGIGESKVNRPIVYLNNLKKNVNKGHLLITTSGQDGVFGQKLLGEREKLQQEIDILSKQLSNIFTIDGESYDYDVAQEVLDFFNQKTDVKRPLKKEFTYAEEYFKETGDRSDFVVLEQRQKAYEEAQNLKKTLTTKMKQIQKEMKPFTPLYNKYLTKMEQLDNYRLIEEKEQAIALYKELEEIFGKENILFEIQNHFNETETNIMKKVTAFAYEMQGDNPNFVIGNDTSIGTEIDSADLEDEIKRLNIAACLDTGEYQPIDKNKKYYSIRKEESLKEGLAHVICDRRRDASGQYIPVLDTDKQNIIEMAIKNTDNILDNCYIIEPPKNNHYPKFCEDENAEFEQKCLKGIPWRFPNGLPEEYQKRLEKELNVIQTMGYAGYHLIVQDYLEYARLLGYLNEDEVMDAPLTIEELDKYLTDNNIERIGTGIGPGRGSAAGSLCCYLLGITDIDPIKYGLIFERFLNPERVSMPDIDSDFRPQVRLKAREYVRHKYGERNVCEIVTKSYDGEKGSMEDVGRYLGFKYSYNTSKEETKKIQKYWTDISTRLRKNYDEMNITGDLSLEDFYKQNQTSLSLEEKEILQLAPLILGMFKGYSQHAAGVIISKDCVGDNIPLMWNSTAKSLQTQCQMAQAEAHGYLKMDFLGLRNLATVTDTTKNPHNKEDITDVCQDAVKRDDHVLNNSEVIKQIFCKGLTQGVFQFESYGMKRMLMNFQPESFDDIILLIAAYRPGPMAYIPEIIAQKWYDKDPEHYIDIISKIYPQNAVDKKGNLMYKHLYPVPQHKISLKNDTLHHILESTYGCPIYQEQIMQIFQEMAGYSLGRADEVRRAMSKKKEEKLEHERNIFIYGNDTEIEEAKAELERLKTQLVEAKTPQEQQIIQKKIDNFKIPAVIQGCIKLQGITKEEANDLFEQMKPFAKYGFNKSHAAAYSVVSMETAWLKAKRTIDFYVSALNNWKKRDEIVPYSKEMQILGIQFLPPRLGKNTKKFSVEGNCIRFPMAKVKNMEADRLNLTNDTSLFAFITHNPKVTLTQLNTFIKLGCFDSCWKYKNEQQQAREVKRVNGSRHAQLSWAKTHYKLILQLTKLTTDIASGTFSEEDIRKKTEEVQGIKEQFKQEAKASINQPPIQNTVQEFLEERAWELDLTGLYFNVDRELEIINKYQNQMTYQDLVNQHRKAISIPCVVLSISDQKFTKAQNPFYQVTFMDKNGTIFERRLNGEPKVTCGIFKLNTEDQKYFISNMIEATDEYITTKDPAKNDIEQLVQNMKDNKDIPSIQREAIEIERGEEY